jgi:GTPase SAR1 family protein
MSKNHNQCIGNLEHHLHYVFANQRVPSEEYVYTPPTEMFNLLEDFCDDQSIHEIKAPLLLLGDSGCGKSALLANWLQRRLRNGRGRSSDDFVYWHAVGCTRQSMDVNSLMRRLMTDLKNRFELSRDVPVTQARLSWDLPRFLDLAAKKGKTIIVVIDGLHRLESQEGEAGLSWLPLTFPPHVRVILSASSVSINDTTNKKMHVIAEVERRQWQIIKMKALDPVSIKTIIDSYIRKTVQTESSSTVDGTFLTSYHKHESSYIHGCILFENQIKEILHHKLSSNPLFLKVILR